MTQRIGLLRNNPYEYIVLIAYKIKIPYELLSKKNEQKCRKTRFFAFQPVGGHMGRCRCDFWDARRCTDFIKIKIFFRIPENIFSSCISIGNVTKSHGWRLRQPWDLVTFPIEMQLEKIFSGIRKNIFIFYKIGTSPSIPKITSTPPHVATYGLGPKKTCFSTLLFVFFGKQFTCKSTKSPLATGYNL